MIIQLVLSYFFFHKVKLQEIIESIFIADGPVYNIVNDDGTKSQKPSLSRRYMDVAFNVYNTDLSE